MLRERIGLSAGGARTEAFGASCPPYKREPKHQDFCRYALVEEWLSKVVGANDLHEKLQCYSSVSGNDSKAVSAAAG